MGRLGYELDSVNPTTGRICYRLVKAFNAIAPSLADTANPPTEVIIGKPDFIADAMPGLRVYDRDYIVDIINKIHGQVGDGPAMDLLVVLAEEHETN